VFVGGPLPVVAEVGDAGVGDTTELSVLGGLDVIVDTVVGGAGLGGDAGGAAATFPCANAFSDTSTQKATMDT
jgi:hypothetical protein